MVRPLPSRKGWMAFSGSSGLGVWSGAQSVSEAPVWMRDRVM